MFRRLAIRFAALVRRLAADEISGPRLLAGKRTTAIAGYTDASPWEGWSKNALREAVARDRAYQVKRLADERRRVIARNRRLSAVVA